MLPRLTQASAPLTREVTVVNEHGQIETVSIPAERPLTIYVDRREVVTLMTLGAMPELLVLGYLRNQRLIRQPSDVLSIMVDWEVNAAAVETRDGITDIDARTAQRVVTTGCGQGSVFGGLMQELDQIQLPADARLSQSSLYGLLNAIRLQETTYKSAGSVHGCALFRGADMLMFVEDVGRHNAIDTLAGWMWMQPESAQRGDDKIFYTTGRLTSEMIMKSAQMGVPIVVSRSGMTQMGYELARDLDLCAIGRAVNRRFVCYTGAHRLILQPELAAARNVDAANAAG
ncbi:formate dehydrogenase accessory sulfurtransferase FdhD [Bordetella sp. 02P26C-1]|uniref:formate dehydrogenase accessory sulfurtransferase FdhD n=1 Tax=Bordetella sp. 02P26C-1 TaxID=2683195 RepID=UPI00192376CF|nr:formate dehydrogenase accessory sulfurtransferase FdhD [Bordetella sp. 02P26C-1]